MTRASHTLEVDGLEISTLKGTKILRDVSVSLRPGEILGLVGESGSGKTTLGLAMVGTLKPGLKVTGGTVKLSGTDLFSLRSEEMRRLRGHTLAYIPQDARASLNPILKIGRQVELLFGRRNAEAADRYQHFAYLLDRVGLSGVNNLMKRYPFQMSGGQLQRLSIAIALASRPPLVVLDEPTTALDAVIVMETLALIRSVLREENAMAVYVSHDISAVQGLCDKLAVVYSGEIVESGETQSILASGAHPYSRGLAAAVPRIESARPPAGIPGTTLSPDKRPDGCAFINRCSFRQADCPVGTPVPVLTIASRSVRCVHAEDVLSTITPSLATPLPAKTNVASLHRGEALSARYIEVTFGTHKALDDVSLVVSAGEKVALLGESGSGKSTLARCLAGLQAEFSGTLSFGGGTLAPSVGERTILQKKAIQFIWQNPYTSLNPRRTVEEIIGQPAKIFFNENPAKTRERVLAAIASVELTPDHLHRHPRQLSGGERQRVAIARAIISEPRILICDEVTAALDVSVQASIVNLLHRLADERGMGVLFISHQLALVRHLVDRACILRNGKIVEVGPIDAIFSNPREDYTRQLVAAARSAA